MKSINQSKKRMLMVFAFLIFVVFLRFSVFQIIRVFSQSMEPTYQEGDVVLAIRKSFIISYNRGDVVTLVVGRDKLLLQKRIIAIEGDTVQLLKNKILVNHKTAVVQALPSGVSEKTIKIPKSSVFVLGDNPAALDSRNFGPIDIKRIESKVWFAFPSFFYRTQPSK